MKKNILLLLMSFFLFPNIALAVDNVDYEISEYKIESNIESNGNLNVCEYIKQTGSFNGYVRDILYKKGDSNYSPTNITNINVYDLNVINMIKGNAFSLDNSAIKGDTLKYTISDNIDGSSITMYNANESGSKGYVLCYTLENSIIVHDDVAELYYNFIPKGFEDLLNNVSVRVNLPKNDDTLKVWGHGALYGTAEKKKGNDNSYLLAKTNYVNAGEVLNIRMTFDKTLVNESTRLVSGNALEDIIKEETALADAANREREFNKRMLYLGYTAIGVYILFIVCLIVYCYKKYDKEYKIDFDMEYYREFPNNYGPEIVEYLIKKNISTNAYSASILNMIYKKNIKIEETEDKKDYKLIKCATFNESPTKEETTILDFLINDIGDGTSVMLSEIKKYGKKESTAKNFLKNFENWKNDVLNASNKYNFFENNSKIKPVLILILFSIAAALLCPTLSFIVIIIGIASLMYIISISKKTKEGMLEYKKWMAFKKFLLDFGRFNEKELPEIILWEKYLVYATIFGIADKVEKTMKIKIESFSDTTTMNDTLFMNYMIRQDFVHTMNSTINNVYTASRSTIASSQASSGSGSGGGFSGGGSFSGGGGGGGGHGF